MFPGKLPPDLRAVLGACNPKDNVIQLAFL